MKRKFMYLFVAMVSLSMVFTACSKDDESSIAKEISKKYDDVNVVVTNNGEVVKGASVEIVEKGENTISLILSNAVNGHSTFEIDAEVSATTKATTYNFAGTKSVEGMEVAVKGNVLNGKVNVSTTVKITSPVVGKWGYSLVVDENFKPIDVISFTIKNDKNEVNYFGSPVSCEDYSIDMSDFIQSLVCGMLNPLELELSSDGYVNVNATYTPFSLSDEKPSVSQKLSMSKLARYYYDTKSGKLIFDAVINIPGSPMNGQTLPVPFDCKIDEKGNLVATIGYEFLSPYVKAFIPKDDIELDGLVASILEAMPADMDELKPFAALLLKETVVNFRDASDYTFTLKLPKVN